MCLLFSVADSLSADDDKKLMTSSSTSRFRLKRNYHEVNIEKYLSQLLSRFKKFGRKFMKLSIF